MDRLRATLGESGGLAVLRLSGSLDSRTDSVLTGAFSDLESRGARRAVLDLSETDYITAAGWGLILDRHRAWKRTGKDFLVAGMNAGVRSLFNFLELKFSLPEATTVSDAVTRLGGRGGNGMVAAA